MSNHHYFAACPKGLENLLLNELTQLGATSVRETVAGVYFSGERIVLYQACLWSRLANKILLPLSTVDSSNEEQLYRSIRDIPWEDHLDPEGTFKVDFLGTDRSIRNTQFGAVRVKDAVVDRFQALFGQRPSVDKHSPDIVINARLSKGKVHVSLDLSGQSLHRRAYRQKQGEAPLKENLASALLLRSQWPATAQQGGYLIDPMCGSATLLIEGTMMAADIAPGLLRAESDWGFTGWLQFADEDWQELIRDAKSRKEKGLHSLREKGFEARGYDRDWRVLRAAEANIDHAGLSEFIRVLCKPVEELSKPSHKPMPHGLVICNPPYGERLGEEKLLVLVYQQLGQVLKQDFLGWHAGILTSNQPLAKHIGIRSQKKYKLWNGTIAAELFVYAIEPDHFYKEQQTVESPWSQSLKASVDDLSEGARMVHNRLQKNQKQLRKWIDKDNIQAYRLYDADIPEYSAAVDVYGEVVHIQEYAAPSSINEQKAKVRFKELIDAVSVALALMPDDIYIKQRKRNRGKDQYEKTQAEDKKPLVIREYNADLLVDLWSYLDTGLFLDHRPVRQLVAKLATNKQFLNLFCYTATATVHAALAGAKSSISVDMSKTYLEWARLNFDKNHLNRDRHQLVQQDCLAWLKNCRQGFDVIMLDPPSFSNSKRMEGVLDIQRDHVDLIQRCMDLLLPGGTLVFSTNLRSFKLAESELSHYHIDNISEQTLDPDFQRNKKIHQCWLIQAK